MRSSSASVHNIFLIIFCECLWNSKIDNTIFRSHQNSSLATHYVLLFLEIASFLISSSSATTTDSIEACCLNKQVPVICAKTLCNPSQVPNDFAIYDVFESKNSCAKHLNPIAKCLASGRDHSPCCSKEAKDLDENACFGLCRGEGVIKSSASYQSCLAINIGAMFLCFQRGYRRSPSSPKNVIIQYVGTNEVELSWDKPEFNENLVDHYVIYLYQMEAESERIDMETEIRIATIGNEARIESLEPGTHYIAKIIALASTNDDSPDDQQYRSLPHELHFKTDGMPPQLMTFKDRVHAPVGADFALLACRIILRGSFARIQRPQIQWEHKSEEHFGSQFQKLDNTARFNASYYEFSKLRPIELIATLKIKRIRSTDFGQWRCKVANEYGESDALIHLDKSSAKPAPNALPPNTPLECCKKLGVQPRCLPMCGSDNMEPKRYVPRPFMNHDCSSEISKVLSCAMPHVDDSECCIDKQLPSQCFYLCDFREAPTNHLPRVCLNHLRSVEHCRLSGARRRPSPIRNLRVSRTDSKAPSLLLRWDSAERADIYYIYWRSKGSADWTNKSTSSTLLRLNTVGVDEIVVVSANDYGVGAATRVKIDNIS